MKKITVLIIALFFLAGCSSLKSIPSAVALDNEIKSGEVTNALNSVDLTQAEEQIITHAINAVANFRNDWGSFIKSPEKLVAINPDMLISDYNNLRDRFNEVNAIGIKNFHRYDRETQMRLSMYQRQAFDLDESVQKYLSKREFRSAMRSALSYGMVAIQVISSFK